MSRKEIVQNALLSALPEEYRVIAKAALDVERAETVEEKKSDFSFEVDLNIKLRPEDLRATSFLYLIDETGNCISDTRISEDFGQSLLKAGIAKVRVKRAT